jgi:F-type H+-transporting ATPase subunit a
MQLFFSVNNPLEQFETYDFLYLLMPIFGFTKLSLTNMGFYLILVVSIVLAMNLLASNHYSLVPSRWSISQESISTSVLNLVRSSIGPKHEIYFPFVYSVFLFILIGNLVGLIPYSFTVTSGFVLNIGLSTAIMIGVTIIGFQRHGLGFFAYFIPSGTPLGLVWLLIGIEVISYLARAVSLGVRLAGNMISGHVLLKIIAMFGWNLIGSNLLVTILGVGFTLVFLFLLCALELGVAALQAYVFTILLCTYIQDALNLH